MSKYKRWLLAMAAAVSVFAMATEGSASAAEKAPVTATVEAAAPTAVQVPEALRAPASVTSNHWWGHEEWFNRSEVRWYAAALSRVSGLISWACGFAGPGAGACRVAAAVYAGWVINTFRAAASAGQCVYWKMLWTGQVVSVSRYACNWG